MTAPKTKLGDKNLPGTLRFMRSKPPGCGVRVYFLSSNERGKLYWTSLRRDSKHNFYLAPFSEVRLEPEEWE